MVKKLVPVIALLAVLGGVYKFVLAKPAKAEPKPSNVVNLFDALKKSLSSDAGASEASTPAKAKPAARRTKPKAGASKRKSV